MALCQGLSAAAVAVAVLERPLGDGKLAGETETFSEGGAVPTRSAGAGEGGRRREMPPQLGAPTETLVFYPQGSSDISIYYRRETSTCILIPSTRWKGSKDQKEN